MKISTLCFYLASALLVGCGGGESSSPTTTVDEDSSSPEEISTVEINTDSIQQTEQRSMVELSVPIGFDYATSDQQQVEINLNSLSSTQAYASIYSEYHQLASGEYQAINTSKIVSSPLTSGQLQMSFSLSGSTSSFLIEIWHIESDVPLQQVFTKGDKQSWLE